MALNAIFLETVNRRLAIGLPTIGMRKMIVQSVALIRLGMKIKSREKHFKVNSPSGIRLKAAIAMKSDQVLPLNIN